MSAMLHPEVKEALRALRAHNGKNSPIGEFCSEVLKWEEVELKESDGGPEDGHTWRVGIVERGSGKVVGDDNHTDAAEFAPLPFIVEVRAWSLYDALREIAFDPFPLFMDRS